MTARLPVMRPLLPRAEAVLPYLHRMDASGIYANRGPLVQELERRYAEYLGLDEKLVVAASSATAGLIGAVRAAEAATWLVPDFTFPAPALAVLAAGAAVSLVDVSITDWQVDIPPGALHAGTALLPVLPFGAPLELDRWPIAATVVVDAASSLGSSRGRLANLPRSWAVVFSLHATKVLPAGEGGLVAFGDAGRAARFREWANFGFHIGGESVTRGQNAKMPEVCAAYALASLDSWPSEEHEWMEAQRTAAAVLPEIDGVRPRPGPVTPNSFWVVQFESAAMCRAASRSLAEGGIESRRWWGALHAMPAFADCDRDDLTTTQLLAQTTLGLPMFRGMSAADAEAVGAAIATAGPA